MWAQGSDKKELLRPVPLLERNIQGNGWKSVMHLFHEKWYVVVRWVSMWKLCRTFIPIFLGWRFGQEALSPVFASEPSAYLPPDTGAIWARKLIGKYITGQAGVRRAKLEAGKPHVVIVLRPERFLTTGFFPAKEWGTWGWSSPCPGARFFSYTTRIRYQRKKKNKVEEEW